MEVKSEERKSEKEQEAEELKIMNDTKGEEMKEAQPEDLEWEEHLEYRMDEETQEENELDEEEKEEQDQEEEDKTKEKEIGEVEVEKDEVETWVREVIMKKLRS